ERRQRASSAIFRSSSWRYAAYWPALTSRSWASSASRKGKSGWRSRMAELLHVLPQRLLGVVQARLDRAGPAADGTGDVLQRQPFEEAQEQHLAMLHREPPQGLVDEFRPVEGPLVVAVRGAGVVVAQVRVNLFLAAVAAQQGDDLVVGDLVEPDAEGLGGAQGRQPAEHGQPHVLQHVEGLVNVGEEAA